MLRVLHCSASILVAVTIAQATPRHVQHLLLAHVLERERIVACECTMYTKIGCFPLIFKMEIRGMSPVLLY